MVDFNNDATISTPAIDIERVLILQYRAECIEALGHYEHQNAQGFHASTHAIRSAILKLYYQLHGSIERRFKEAAIKELKTLMQSSNAENLRDAYLKLSTYLDGLGLTKIDTKPSYDTTNPELSNKAKGL